MNGSFFRRFVVSFLVFSVLSGSSALVVSSFFSDSPEDRSLVAIESAQRAESQNAFRLESSSPSFTQSFAESLARALIEENPEGPQMSEGKLSLAAPDMNRLLDQYIKERAGGTPLSFSPSSSREKIKTVKEFTAQSAYDYFLSVKSVYGEISESKRVENLLSRDGTEEAILAALVFLGETKDDLYRTEVPEPLVGYHASILDLLETEHAYTLALLEDPLRAVALEKTFRDTVQKNIRALEKETSAASEKISLLVSASSKNRALSRLLDEVFSIEKASAAIFVPVLDSLNLKANTTTATINTKSLIQKIYEWLIKVAKEWLKNRLMKELTNMMVSWATGGEYKLGQSFKTSQNFITNWKSYLLETFNQAAGDFINKLSPELCQGNIGDLVTLDLKTTYYGDKRPPVVCTLTQVVTNLENFAQDFRAGGWLGYNQTYLPAGNYYGSLWFGSQFAERVAQRKEDAKRSEAEAGAGYKGKKKLKCADGTAVDNEGLCGNDEPAIEETTVPPATLKDTVSSALEAPIHRLANADTWEALVAYLLDTLTAKLIASGDEGFSGNNYLSATAADQAKICAASYTAGTQQYNDCLLNTTNPPIQTDEIPPDELPIEDPETGCKAPSWTNSTGGEPGDVVNISRAEPFTPEPDSSFLEVKIPMASDKNYVRAQVDVDVTIGPRDSAKPEGLHNIFWMQRGEDADRFIWNKNVLGYLNLRWRDDGSHMRFGNSLNWDVGEECGTINSKNDSFDADAVFKEGETYHFRMVYDVLDGETGAIRVVATNQGGGVVASINYDRTANVIQSDRPTPKSGRNPSGFFVHFGDGNDDPELEEAFTYGWKYENIRIQMTPGNGRPAGTSRSNLPEEEVFAVLPEKQFSFVRGNDRSGKPTETT